MLSHVTFALYSEGRSRIVGTVSVCHLCHHACCRSLHSLLFSTFHTLNFALCTGRIETHTH